MNNILIFMNGEMKLFHWNKEKDSLNKNVYSLEHNANDNFWIILIYESYITDKLAFSFSNNIPQLRELYYQRFPDTSFTKSEASKAKMHIEYFITYYNKIMQKMSAFL